MSKSSSSWVKGEVAGYATVWSPRPVGRFGEAKRQLEWIRLDEAKEQMMVVVEEDGQLVVVVQPEGKLREGKRQLPIQRQSAKEGKTGAGGLPRFRGVVLSSTTSCARRVF